MPHVAIPEDTFRRLAARAAALNVSVDDLVKAALDRLAATGTPPPEPPLRLTGDAWRAELDTTSEGRVQLSLSGSTSVRRDLTTQEGPGTPSGMDPEQGCTEAETIRLGGFERVDELNAPFIAARPKPRGLLPVPPEVESAVAEDDSWLLKDHGIVPTFEDRQRQVNSLTLQYYYGGHDVAYRLTPQGVELLAAGLSEISQLTQGMSQEELLTIKIGQP